MSHIFGQQCERSRYAETPATFGLIAGLGVGAGIFYYRSLVNAHRALTLSPRIVIAHADVERVMGLANARESRQLAEYLTELLDRLARAGAQFATVPAFSPQICARELAERTPLPLIDLLDSIVAEVSRRRLTRVAVFGASVTMETGLFGCLQGITDVISPRRDEIDRIASIYGEIVRNERAEPEEFGTIRALAHELVRREKLDAILLAGTDFAFVFNPDNTDFPHLDGARTHLDEIMRRLTSQARST